MGSSNPFFAHKSGAILCISGSVKLGSVNPYGDNYSYFHGKIDSYSCLL